MNDQVPREKKARIQINIKIVILLYKYTALILPPSYKHTALLWEPCAYTRLSFRVAFSVDCIASIHACVPAIESAQNCSLPSITKPGTCRRLRVTAHGFSDEIRVVPRNVRSADAAKKVTCVPDKMQNTRTHCGSPSVSRPALARYKKPENLAALAFLTPRPLRAISFADVLDALSSPISWMGDCTLLLL